MADTDCIVIMGFNMAENHPVAFLSVMDEYRFAATPPEHTAWLLSGAPSADSEDGKPDAGGIDGERRRKVDSTPMSTGARYVRATTCGKDDRVSNQTRRGAKPGACGASS
jgi:hypothetical protein